MNSLTEEERLQLHAQHKKKRDKRICDRIKAVLLYGKGWTFQEIAEVLLLPNEAIRNYTDKYRALKKLRPKSGSSVEKLSSNQSRQLEDHLQAHAHLYVKDIVAYIQLTFKITYTIRGIRNGLQRHGFSYKKLAIEPGNADQQQQKE
ncbi:winged helix-turn-helix domain-containing protein [Parachlamydia sp. AcF125]|uniref:helix-turn-helix domain-containing protein n=1 Tax=Parachlamydia sp. AcF125 TaxID=2795736 RepID=UPI001BCA547E|nr:winged helix-turn-helix domain-containing protein [Parachlamydia sp. AcF125]MBS4168115.1 hypothetical protein [Parachlamydia sp. AcF125]